MAGKTQTSMYVVDEIYHICEIRGLIPHNTHFDYEEAYTLCGMDLDEEDTGDIVAYEADKINCTECLQAESPSGLIEEIEQFLRDRVRQPVLTEV